MSGGPSPSRRVVVDAIVLAFTYSDLKEVVGTDALRDVLDVEYHDLIKSGTLDLQVLWELLEEQPGFVAEAAIPPVCVIKGWEDRLRIPVTLPDVIKDYGDRERAIGASKCVIPPAQVKKVFESPDDKARRLAEQRARQSIELDADEIAPPVPQRKASWHDRRGVAIAAAVVGAAALAFVTISLMRVFGSPDWQAFDPSVIAADVPAASGKRMGKQVGLTLADDGWLSRPRAEVRADLENALRALQASGVDVVYVKDRSGALRVTAQTRGSGVSVKFIEARR